MKGSIRKNVWLTAAVILMSFAVALIFAGCGSSSSSSSKSSEKKKVDLSQVPKTYTLDAGSYVVGKDIPSGKCDFALASGSGNLMDDGSSLNEVFGSDTDFDEVSSFKGYRAKKGRTVYVMGSLKVNVTYSDVTSTVEQRSYDESKAKDYVSGSYVVGEDIDAGTYNFTLVSGEGNLDTDDGELNEVMSTDTQFGTTSYHNAKLSKGETLHVSGCTVKAVPESK
jgi:ABC-type oligopeptide transport system substrate-binding subunit